MALKQEVARGAFCHILEHLTMIFQDRPTVSKATIDIQALMTRPEEFLWNFKYSIAIKE